MYSLTWVYNKNIKNYKLHITNIQYAIYNAHAQAHILYTRHAKTYTHFNINIIILKSNTIY